MANKIECATHGECLQTFVCIHLLGEQAGLGFNRNEPTHEDPFPDAWCDDCELIRSAHDGWNKESEELTKFSLLCSGCYERSRIRNTKPTITLSDLADLRWKCAVCDEWHRGPCLDFGYDAPFFWLDDHEKASKKYKIMPKWSKNRNKTFLTSDYCVTDDEYFYVRGVIHLPIIGAAETLRWGVWGSLSRDNFYKLRELDESPDRTGLAPMFSWLSNRIPEYPETLSLKMYAHIQEPGTRPYFFLQPTEHPLSQEYHHGITPERVREIMMRRVRDCEAK